MGRSASSLLLAGVLLASPLGAQKSSSPARPAPAPTYGWVIEPEDALWGHLSEGAFREPVGVFWEPAAKELYVADSKNGRVGIFDAEGTPVFSFGGAAVLIEPRAVLALTDGTIHVLDGDRTELRRFNYRGEPTSSLTFAAPLTAGGERVPLLISAIARDASGRWYVADRNTNRAWVFDAQLEPLLELPPPIEKTRFEAISDIAVSAEGLVAISDQRGEPVIHVYDASGKMLYAFGEHDIGLDNFTAAIALTFDESGFLYVVDLLRHDVKVFTPAGRMVTRFGGWFSPETRGRAPGELLYPADITVVPDGPIWVAERFGQRVQKFQRKRVDAASATPTRRRDG